jgi:hypothetical protein
MIRSFALVTAAMLASTPLAFAADAPATPGSGSKVEATTGAKPNAGDPTGPAVESGKAAPAGSGSKVEATPGGSGATEAPPAAAGSSQSGARDVSGAGGATQPQGHYPSEKAQSASPGADKQGDMAGPAEPAKK